MTIQMFPVSLHLQRAICWLKVVPTTTLRIGASILQRPTSSAWDVRGQGLSQPLGVEACPWADPGSKAEPKGCHELGCPARDGREPPSEGWGCAGCGALRGGRKSPGGSRMGGCNPAQRPPLLSLCLFLLCLMALCPHSLDPWSLVLMPLLVKSCLGSRYI